MFQIFNSTMVGAGCSSPRESLSSISRVQTVVSIAGAGAGVQGVQGVQEDSLAADLETCAEMTGSYTRLQRELGILQEKLNNVSVIITSAANRLIGEVVQSQRRPLLGPSPG